MDVEQPARGQFDALPTGYDSQRTTCDAMADLPIQMGNQPRPGAIAASFNDGRSRDQRDMSPRDTQPGLDLFQFAHLKRYNKTLGYGYRV